MDYTDISSSVRRCPDHGTRSKRVPIRQVLSSGVKRVDAFTVYDPHFIRLIDVASVQYGIWRAQHCSAAVANAGDHETHVTSCTHSNACRDCSGR